MTQSPEHRRLIRLAQSINRRAFSAGRSETITAEELASVVRAFPRCYYCGIGLEPGQGSFDHRISLTNGGINRPVNIVRACLTCNRVKFDKTPDELRAYTALTVRCKVCGREYRPRWAEWKAGRGQTCSRRCAAASRFMKV